MSFSADQFPSERRSSAGADKSQAALVLADLLSVVWRHWVLIGGSAISGALILIAISYTIEPTFRAVALYAPAAPQQTGGSSLLGGQAAGLASLAGISVSDTNGLQRLAALIQSRAIALQALRGEKALPALFPKRWDSEAGHWKKEPSEEDIINAFNGARVVVPDASANMVSVQVTLRDPALAARLANRLAFYVNEYERNRARDESQRAMAYLNRQLEGVAQSTLRDALTYQMSTELQKATMINARKDYVLEIIDPALVPELKIAPKRSMFAVFGLMLGGGLALLIAYYRFRKAAHSVGILV